MCSTAFTWVGCTALPACFHVAIADRGRHAWPPCCVPPGQKAATVRQLDRPPAAASTLTPCPRVLARPLRCRVDNLWHHVAVTWHWESGEVRVIEEGLCSSSCHVMSCHVMPCHAHSVIRSSSLARHLPSWRSPFFAGHPLAHLQVKLYFPQATPVRFLSFLPPPCRSSSTLTARSGSPSGRLVRGRCRWAGGRAGAPCRVG